MQYFHIKSPTTFFPDNFCKPFDGLFVCLDPENVEDGKTLSLRKAHAFIKDSLNYSWDGSIYWFPDVEGKKFLEFSEQWFQENFETMEDDAGEGVSNCLMYSKTATGMAFVDTQIDSGSKIDELIDQFSKAYPKESKKYKYIEDCHLVDNLKFGRHHDHDLDNTLKFLVSEQFLTYNVLLWSEYGFFKKLPVDKPIVLTGTFSSSREHIKSTLEQAGFTVANTISANSWLWAGKDAGASKLDAAAKKGIKISSIDEVLDIFFKANYPQKPKKKI